MIASDFQATNILSKSIFLDKLAIKKGVLP
jgi:hypothetical protein